MVTIHSDHPFIPPEGDRDPLRRLRGRMPSAVTLWTTGSGARRRGLTVSSVMIAAGEPAHVVGLVDDASDFWDAEPELLVVNVLSFEHHFLADVFAGVAPAPGGPFTTHEWTDSTWGPVLAGTAGWIGVRRVDTPPRQVGWGLLVEGVVEEVAIGQADAMVHVRGRYRRVEANP